jgi:hypothetical protein
MGVRYRVSTYDVADDPSRDGDWTVRRTDLARRELYGVIVELYGEGYDTPSILVEREAVPAGDSGLDVFDPHWTDRRLEAEMDTGRDPEPECRLCACTDSSACEAGCGWVDGQDLCTACAALMEQWPILRQADGYGLAAMPEPEPQGAGDDDDDPPMWICVCGAIVESAFCCPECTNEPPWGCDCSLHDDEDEEPLGEWPYLDIDADDIYGPVFGD